MAWMAFLFWVSSRTGFGPVPVSEIPDLLTHGAGYAVLAVLACRALARGLRRPVPPRVALLAVLISIAYGVTDEWHQSFVPGRFADGWDLVKDFVGAAAGALACAWPRPETERRRKAA